METKKLFVPCESEVSRFSFLDEKGDKIELVKYYF